MKEIILRAVFAWFAEQTIEWTGKGINYLVEKIKQAEKNIEGKGLGETKWQRVWEWLLEDVGEELSQHQEGIKDLVGQLVKEMNKKQLWP